MTDVHPTAVVEEGAVLGRDCSIGAFTLVHANVRLADGGRVGSHCVIGHTDVSREPEPLVIGAGAHIRSHSVFYGGSTFGRGLTTGHTVTVRDGTIAGEGVQLGSLMDCQGDIRIGDHVRTQSRVLLCRGATVGSFVWIFPSVVTTNDPHPPSELNANGPTIDDFAVVATNCVLLPGVRVGAGALVGAHSLVNRDVPPGRLVAGVPAVDRGPASRIQLQDGSGPAYPWTQHFRRGYPESITDEW